MKALNPAAEAQLAARVFALGFLCGAVRNQPNRNDMLATARTLPARDCRGRFVARAGGARAVISPARPARPMQARDRRGRFVSRTASAPSWYVFSAEAYRIPGEPPTILVAPTPSPAPAATAARKRRWFTRSNLESALLVLLITLVSSSYAAHLPRPQW
jgi:hypothetical protein